MRPWSSRSPVSVIRTSTDRRRCRSIPTICCPSYAPLTGASSNRWREHLEHEPRVTRSGGPAPPSHQRGGPSLRAPTTPSWWAVWKPTGPAQAERHDPPHRLGPQCRSGARGPAPRAYLWENPTHARMPSEVNRRGEPILDVDHIEDLAL